MTEMAAVEEGAGKGEAKKERRPKGVAKATTVRRMIRRYHNPNHILTKLCPRSLAYHRQLLQAHGVQVPQLAQ
jgi:hypothetical protein